MNIKILSSLITEMKRRNNLLIIGTHNGIFHSDEIVACAILCLIYSYSNISVQILRTRETEFLMQCDICVDIGAGKFDHHQAGFNKVRENGIKYASAGLVWRQYGELLIDSILKKYFPETCCNTASILKSFDDSVISLVDCEDNGIKAKEHCFSFVSSFLPIWFNNRQKSFNKQFSKALSVTISVLEQELKLAIAKEISKDVVENNWKNEKHSNLKILLSNTAIQKQKLKTKIAKKTSHYIVKAHWKNTKYFKQGILEIPAQTVFWAEPTIHINTFNKNNLINFVIFPYLAGGWAAQCVPPTLEKQFAQRIPFPSEWAGQTNKLAEISGIKGATFCHNGCFFVRATTKEAIIQLCCSATNSIQ